MNANLLIFKKIKKSKKIKNQEINLIFPQSVC